MHFDVVTGKLSKLPVKEHIMSGKQLMEDGIAGSERIY